MPIVGRKETPRLTSRLAHACHQRNCLKLLRSVRSVWRTVALRQKRRRSTGEQPWPYIALWLASTVLHLPLDLKYSQKPRCQGAAVYMSRLALAAPGAARNLSSSHVSSTSRAARRSTSGELEQMTKVLFETQWWIEKVSQKIRNQAEAKSNQCKCRSNQITHM